MNTIALQAEYIRSVVRKLNRAFERQIRSKAEQKGITVPQMRVIEAVVDHPGISIRDLSLRLQLTQSTISGIVDRLEQAQLAERRTNPKDKRSASIYASPSVMEFMRQEMPAFVSEPLIGPLSELPRDKLEEIIRGMRILEDIFLKERGG